MTGGAGFIGSYIVETFLSMNYEVVVVDNLESGSLTNLHNSVDNPNLKIYQIDCSQCEEILYDISDCDYVFHLAANPDIRKSQKDPDIDFQNNIVNMYNFLKCLSSFKSLKKIIFSSSSVVYGEPTKIPTPENYGPLIPLSSYGATKLAGEAMLSFFANKYEFQALIFRFANVIGGKSNHGIIFDLINKLKDNPDKLVILGNGKQQKSYLHISDCISGILAGMNSTNKVDIFNLGTDQQTIVTDIAKIIISQMGLSNVNLVFDDPLNDGRGWSGDVTHMGLDCSKIKSLGWIPKFSSTESIEHTCREILSPNMK